jgi:hypothetical protein
MSSGLRLYHPILLDLEQFQDATQHRWEKGIYNLHHTFTSVKKTLGFKIWKFLTSLLPLSQVRLHSAYLRASAQPQSPLREFYASPLLQGRGQTDEKVPILVTGGCKTDFLTQKKEQKKEQPRMKKRTPSHHITSHQHHHIVIKSSSLCKKTGIMLMRCEARRWP